MLANLKQMYESYGLEMPSHELSDYLPLMCEFIYAAEWMGHPYAAEDFPVFIGVIEDGTYHLLQSLEQESSPYYHLIKALRETMKSFMIQEEANHELS